MHQTEHAHGNIASNDFSSPSTRCECVNRSLCYVLFLCVAVSLYLLYFSFIYFCYDVFFIFYSQLLCLNARIDFVTDFVESAFDIILASPIHTSLTTHFKYVILNDSQTINNLMTNVRARMSE